MRISVRRFQPGAVFASFLGILDIKLGCELILLFGLINKVAGVYGLITVFVGGTFVQFLFYAYSFATLFAFLWALNVIKSETAQKTLLVAHLYVLDHAIVWIFHYIFMYDYWHKHHDGRPILNSPAQQDIYDLAKSRGEIEDLSGSEGRTEAENREVLATQIWNNEKNFALGVVFFGFLLKIYFILVIYSYAAHLRSATYHMLPLTRDVNPVSSAAATREAVVRASMDLDRASLDFDRGELAAAEAEVARFEAEEAAINAANANGRKSPRQNGRGKKARGSDDEWE